MKTSKKDYYLNFFGLTSIGILSALYVYFRPYFAEMNVQLSFLDFPIFVGEIFLFVCILIAAFKKKKLDLKRNYWLKILLCYFCFVLFKAFYGYSHWGPLAFRHSALFYYPSFAILCFYFYDSMIFTESRKIVLLCFFLIIFFFRAVFIHYVMTYFLMSLILIFSLKNKYYKIFVFSLLLLLLPYQKFFNTSRMMMLSNCVTSVFLLFVCFFIVKIKKVYKYLFFVSFIVLMSLGYAKFSNKIELLSIFDFKQLVALFKEIDLVVQEKKATSNKKLPKKNKVFNSEYSSFYDLENQSIIDWINGVFREDSVTKSAHRKTAIVDVAGEDIDDRINIAKIDNAVSEVRSSEVVVNETFVSDEASDISGVKTYTEPEKGIEPSYFEKKDEEEQILHDIEIEKALNENMYSEARYKEKDAIVQEKKATSKKKLPEKNKVFNSEYSSFYDLENQSIIDGINGVFREDSVTKSAHRKTAIVDVAGEDIDDRMNIAKIDNAVSEVGSSEVVADETFESDKVPDISGVNVYTESEKGIKNLGIETFNIDEVVRTEELMFVNTVENESIEQVRIVKEEKSEKKDQEEKNLQDIGSEKTFNESLYSEARYNSLFRIFIWRDMMEEFFEKKPILGFDFGKPLMPITLQVFDWSVSNWQRDGWISPHNSYLHMIYRGGIIGFLFIISIFVVLYRMIKNFMRERSIIGILLCGIIINWMVAANFLVIFELPYYSIPFWSIFGLTFAYFKKSELKLHKYST